MILVLVLAAPSLHAQEVETTKAVEDAPARRLGVIFGGAFEDFDVVGPVEGAKTTRMAAHYEWDFGVRAFTDKTWEERGLDWERFFPLAREVADTVATELEPKLVRDHREIVLYAIIADEDPFLTSALLSPKFYGRFRETLGDRILVVLLERNRIYLFPATGGTLEEFSPSLVEEYRRARFPVSLEIFLLDREGFRVVGELERGSAAGPYSETEGADKAGEEAEPAERP